MPFSSSQHPRTRPEPASDNEISDATMQSADEEENASTKSPQLPIVRLPNPQPTPAQDSHDIDSLLQTLELIQKRIASLQIQVESKLDRLDERTNLKVPKPQQSQSGRRGRRPQHVIQLQNAIHQYAQHRLRIDLRQSPTLWPVPDKSQVELFNKGLPSKDSPNRQDLRVDWFYRGSTAWTKTVASIFATEFLALHERGEFPLVRTRPHMDAVIRTFEGYIIYLKRKYLDVMDNPIQAAFKKAEADKRSRSQNRREQLLGRRIALLRHHEFPEESIELLENLDIDGMSSEDSVGEPGTRRTYKIKKLPWRNQELTAWLQRVDSLPLKNARQSILPRRSDYRTRMVSDLVSDSRPPVPGLPSAVYKAEWLQTRNPKFIEKLKVQDIKFSLPPIDQYIPRC